MKTTLIALLTFILFVKMTPAQTNLHAPAAPGEKNAISSKRGTGPGAAAAPTIKPAVARLEFRYDQVPMFVIDGKEQPVMHYFAFGVNEKLIGNCCEVGLHLYWLSADVIGWQSEGDYDFKAVDDSLEGLGKADPQARALLVVPLDNVYQKSLGRWADQHPEELARDETGNMVGEYAGRKSRCPSMASKVWLNESANILRALIRHVRSGPYADRVIGYAPISGISWEWMYWGAQSKEFLDYSRPFQLAFQNWAKEKYDGNLELLNQNWHKQFASFEDIGIPTKEERLRTDYGDLLDPRRSQYVIDFVQCFSEVVADAIIFLCKAIKDETAGDSLTGFYYGYTLYVCGPYWQHHTGHFALKKVLDSPYVDFLMSPSRYGDRVIGGASGFMGPEGSVKLHKKLWISEADNRTLHSNQTIDRLYTLADSVAVLEREFGRALVAGCGVHWFDFALGWITKDKRLMQVVGRLLAIEREMLGVKRKTLSGRNSIAVIVSEQSVFYAGLASATHAELNGAYGCFSRTGVGADFFLLEDLDKIPKDYRCYVIEGALCIREKQKAAINKRLKRNGNVVVWLYAPGITDGKQISIENVGDITGFKMGMQETRSQLKVKTSDSKQGILACLPGPIIYGSNEALSPMLYAEDGEVLGILEGVGKPGLAVKKFPKWTSIYSAAPNLPPALLRGIAQYAGLPVVNAFEGDVTYVNDRLVLVHTTVGGERHLNFSGKSGKVKEMISAKEFELENGYLTVNLKPRSTYIFLEERD